MSRNNPPIPMHAANDARMEVNALAKLADLTESLYEQGLLLSAIIQLLVEKQLFTAGELNALTASLDARFSPPPALPNS